MRESWPAADDSLAFFFLFLFNELCGVVCAACGIFRICMYVCMYMSHDHSFLDSLFLTDTIHLFAWT